ncbi:MAG: 30S ribosomal protein S20 [Myxococcales bacterium]|nr:MAG: 30S ribosomal protein S20 [Myxococcales bacterium]
MANHPSAEKRNRQRITRTDRNRAAKSALRSTVKKARAAIAAGTDAVKAKSGSAAAEKALAKAASKGIIHPRTAARQTSRIAKALAKSAKA